MDPFHRAQSYNGGVRWNWASTPMCATVQVRDRIGTQHEPEAIGSRPQRVVEPYRLSSILFGTNALGMCPPHIAEARTDQREVRALADLAKGMSRTSIRTACPTAVSGHQSAIREGTRAAHRRIAGTSLGQLWNEPRSGHIRVSSAIISNCRGRFQVRRAWSATTPVARVHLCSPPMTSGFSWKWRGEDG